MIEMENDLGKFEYITDANLSDVSVTGLGFSTGQRLSVGCSVRVSLQYKKFRFDLTGEIVRSFGQGVEENQVLMYGVEIDEEDCHQMKKIIEHFVMGFSPERSRDCLVSLALAERYKSAQEGFEIFSLMLSLFKDITHFGNQQQFVVNMLEEVTRIVNAQRASIFLINPETNELEAIAALGIDKELLKFDYRKGIAGSVFTTGVALNIDCKTDTVRFSQDMDNKTGFMTKSIICYPMTNRFDKVIGVIEVLNKRNEDRFTIEDEKTMKVLSLIFSSVFHDFNPISEKSLIRRFSTPYDREFAFVGRSAITNEMRKGIVRLKDLDSPLLISGEKGVGKKLIGRIIHQEGSRGLKNFAQVHCQGKSFEHLEKEIFGSVDVVGVLEECAGGTVLFDEISYLPLDLQAKLIQSLQDRRVVGSVNKISLDVRVIFTSSSNLEVLTYEDGVFNVELFNYLKVSTMYIEPVRKRVEDIPDLVNHFLKKECSHQGLLLKELSEKVLIQFQSYEWPGNVEELQDAVAKIVLYNPKAHVIDSIVAGSTPVFDPSKQSLSALDSIPFAKDHSIALKDRVALIEREMIFAEIKRHKNNKSKAAKAMGISREALRKKLLISDEILDQLGGNNVTPLKKAA
jgi:Nif-specific regulatory protein